LLKLPTFRESYFAGTNVEERMKNFNSNTEDKDEWLTPPEIIKEIGQFDLDPCAPHPDKRPWDTAHEHYHEEIDGLKKPWSGRVWCNPPYGNRTFEWMAKLARHGNGIALIFARTETKGFHREVWEKADAMFFFQGRLKFYHVSGIQGGTANAPSCLVAYGEECAELLKEASLRGIFITLKKQRQNRWMINDN